MGITPAYAGKSIPCRFPADGERDHPRVCGEKPAKISRDTAKKGSPPRMRGKDSEKSLSLWKAGITPAYAGKRGFLPFLGIAVRDHPRVCGEKQIFA